MVKDSDFEDTKAIILAHLIAIGSILLGIFILFGLGFHKVLERYF